jgi:ubiquinone/menaquinone biosynthesis C-methylase UbiE
LEIVSRESAHLNETDNYGPAFMRVAARLGSYDTTAEDAANTIELLGLGPGAKVLDAGCGPTYLVADLLEPLPEGIAPFDALVSVYSSFGYGATEAEDMAMLRAFHRDLKPGGRLLIQLSDLERSRYRLKTDEGVVVRETNGVKETLDVDFSTGMLHVRYELDGEIVDSRIRMYEAEDLERMVEEVGFRDVKRYGDFAGGPKRPEDRQVLVATA